MDRFCETVACGSAVGLTVTDCAGLHCADHAVAHRFCTKDYGQAGCVVEQFTRRNQPLPIGLAAPNYVSGAGIPGATGKPGPRGSR